MKFFDFFAITEYNYERKNFYSYKNIMPENDKSLEWVVDNIDLSSISLQDLEAGDLSIEATPSNIELKTPEIEGNDVQWNNTDIQWNNSEIQYDNTDVQSYNTDSMEQSSSTINESVFLYTWYLTGKKSNVTDEWENFWKYLRQFFIATIIILLWVIAIAIIFLFDDYITKASQDNLDEKDRKYVEQYKPRVQKVKNLLWIVWENYPTPVVWWERSQEEVNKIINATDIDYIEKKDILSNYVPSLVDKAQSRASYVESLKQEIARQWFLPEELDNILSNENAIDTIQRSLNALEVIKFSTATKVFSYMNTALTTIVEMMKVWWANIDTVRQLFKQLWERWEKDITSYVYMCYLNPFETNANCDTIWDLDLYYNNIINDKWIDIKLFKNSMNVISQLLEKNDTSLFSITFNWFNAQDKKITFSIEVFTNQDDERTLISQWKRNPNIFILTNIINLLKQSSFIIWAEINTKEVHVEPMTINLWWLQRKVNYSTMNFTVPIQKNTEREIFDYIDLKSIEKLLSNISNKTNNTEASNWDDTNEDILEQESIQENYEELIDDEYLDVTEREDIPSNSIESEELDESNLENGELKGEEVWSSDIESET